MHSGQENERTVELEGVKPLEQPAPLVTHFELEPALAHSIAPERTSSAIACARVRACVRARIAREWLSTV
jgi:hypothetical protein